MTLKGAARWKPDAYRSTLSTTVANFDPQATPPIGEIVMVAQLVVYDDVIVTPANYKPGDPSTERNLVILYEHTVTKSLSGFENVNMQDAAAIWAAELTSFRDWILPAGMTLVTAIWTARTAGPMLI